ncbi:MAG: ABC transporter substrate-binding protein [Nitrospinae bacterium]|nr:ABC transporter substrate-binding protein [Nitrospinota bacterium]MBF0633895.1 ABC transporter substrate-binding protein [Nitrospinota bacterium]
MTRGWFCWDNAALFAFIAFFSFSCSKTPAVEQGSLTMALEAGPAMIDPLKSTDAVAAKIEGLVFNGLVKRNDDFTISPDLAERWEFIADPLRAVFHLRSGVKFHDGSAFTSNDVKRAMDFILNPENASPLRSSFADVKSVEVSDDHTVIFNLNRKTAPFLSSLTLGIPKLGASNPVGTGPFRIVEIKRDDKVILERNAVYFDGAPKMSRLIIKIIPDETVRTLSLESGEVQIIMNPITPDLLPRFRENQRLKAVTSPSANYSYLGFNMEDPLAGNIAVRKAVAHAIDRQSVMSHILKGLAEPATGPISPNSGFYEGAVERYGYDPEKAKKILDEAGFPDPDGSGPTKRFTLRYSTSQNELRRRIAEVFQWQLEKVGIGLDIRSYEWGAFYADIKKGNFQIFSLTWVGVADPDILRYMFHSESMPPDGANRGRYKNAELDLLLSAGVTADGEGRRRVYSEAQKIIARDLPYVSLWRPLNVAVTDRRVREFHLSPDEGIKSLKNVYVEN